MTRTLSYKFPPKRRQINSAYRLKKIIDPNKSKILNEKNIKSNLSEEQDNKIMMDKKWNQAKEQNDVKRRENNLIKAEIEKRELQGQ
jgi:hypothetical protein